MIDERINEIEKNETDLVNENTKKLGEIEKIMERTNREVETLVRVIGGLRK